jgi:hypothetical protein
MAWWDTPAAGWNQQGAAPVAAQRFSQFDAGGDFDVDGVPGVSYQDYITFLNTYLGGDAANFGKPGYEMGTQYLTTPRVQPQQTASQYQMMTMPDGTRIYGNQQNMGNVAFKQNNPVTAAQVPVGQSAILAAQQAALPPPPKPMGVQVPTLMQGQGVFGAAKPQKPAPAGPGMFGNY